MNQGQRTCTYRTTDISTAILQSSSEHTQNAHNTAYIKCLVYILCIL